MNKSLLDMILFGPALFIMNAILTYREAKNWSGLDWMIPIFFLCVSAVAIHDLIEHIFSKDKPND